MNVITAGQLRGAIRGFHNRETLFTFTNGQIWQQAEYKYRYQYLYSPSAQVVDGPDGIVIRIEGIDDTIKVSQVALTMRIGATSRGYSSKNPSWSLSIPETRNSASSDVAAFPMLIIGSLCDCRAVVATNSKPYQSVNGEIVAQVFVAK
jgi:hypothetical protein